jgi:hypothetical protein
MLSDELQCICSALDMYLQLFEGIRVGLSLKFKFKVFLFVSKPSHLEHICNLHIFTYKHCKLIHIYEDEVNV